jgi:hypothetical protein
MRYPITMRDVAGVLLCGLAGAALVTVLVLNPVATVPGATSPPPGVTITWTIEVDPATGERAWKYTDRLPDGREVASGYLAPDEARVPPEPMTPGVAAISGLGLGLLVGSAGLYVLRSLGWPANGPLNGVQDTPLAKARRTDRG